LNETSPAEIQLESILVIKWARLMGSFLQLRIFLHGELSDLNEKCAIYHESLEGPVVGVQKHTGHRANLSRPIPAIRAMNQDTDPFLCHGLCACHARTLNQYRSKRSCMG